MIMSEAGFLEIFVNNDAQTPVYFDNLRVTQSVSTVKEVNAYYPFGMLIGALSFQAAGDEYNAYKYNDKELQTEMNLNWGDHGARMADYTVGRWMCPDPLAEKYYSISPYVYTLNNPIRFIDPDGRKVMVAGSDEFKKAVFDAMQQLSSNNLVMLKSGQVLEASKYKGNKDNITHSGTGSGDKEFGTKLVGDLASNTKHTLAIKEISGEKNNYLPTDITYKSAQTEGVGDGGTLSYDPNSTGHDIVNEDGTTRVSAFIILGHELIHADKAMKGKTLDNKNEDIYDPASPDNWSQHISEEEVDTRIKENFLRKEHKSSGVKQRKVSKSWEK